MKLIKNNIDLKQYIGDDVSLHDIKPASDFLSLAKDHFFNPKNSVLSKLPWHKTHKDFEFRNGEVSLWGGINGHGKSQISTQVALELIKQNERVCIASLEMKPHKTIVRMLRQASGVEEPTPNYIDEFGRYSDNKLWMYDHVGSCKPETMLAVIRYAIANYNITHFFIDNLMKIVDGEDKYNEQKDFVNKLCTIANDTGVHIHLILHVKKGQSEYCIPNKFDIKGTGAISDLVDNVFLVWRNKEKEDFARKGDYSKDDEPDCMLILCKQRNGEEEGSYGLFFDKRSFQYLEFKNQTSNILKVERFISEIAF